MFRAFSGNRTVEVQKQRLLNLMAQVDKTKPIATVLTEEQRKLAMDRPACRQLTEIESGRRHTNRPQLLARAGGMPQAPRRASYRPP